MKSGRKKDRLMILRGNGAPSDQDVLYGSIYATSPEKETMVRLQNKFLYLMNVLQMADVKPSNQLIDGVNILQQSLMALIEQYEDLK